MFANAPTELVDLIGASVVASMQAGRESRKSRIRDPWKGDVDGDRAAEADKS